jgi:hypothetical protein
MTDCIQRLAHPKPAPSADSLAAQPQRNGCLVFALSRKCWIAGRLHVRGGGKDALSILFDLKSVAKDVRVSMKRGGFPEF